MPTPDDIAKVIEVMEDVRKTIGPWDNCQHCGADKSHQEVRNYDPMWGDGDVYCTACGGRVRTFDTG